MQPRTLPIKYGSSPNLLLIKSWRGTRHYSLLQFFRVAVSGVGPACTKWATYINHNICNHDWGPWKSVLISSRVAQIWGPTSLLLHTSWIRKILELCKIWDFHGGDYEECRLLGYKAPVRTSQDTHYVSATELSQLMLCKVWGFHCGHYEECRLLGCYAVWPL
jgi:hypothetical protein